MKRTTAQLWIILLLLATCGHWAFAAKRNPFSRPGFLMADQDTAKKKTESAPDVALANLKLTGIINQSVAMINHSFYRKGDRVGLFTITDIRPNKVVLTYNGAQFDLVLNIKMIQIKKE